MPTVEVRRFTRDEYERMVRAGIFAPGVRAELIDGEILTVSPQDSPHATGICLALAALQRAFGPGSHVRVQMPLALDDHSEPEPDIVVVYGSARDYRDHHPETAALLVEVSDSSLTHDQTRKASLYARAGVADYWILNLSDRRLEVYRDPAPAATARDGWGYADVRHFGPDESASPLAAPGSPIKVADLLP